MSRSTLDPARGELDLAWELAASAALSLDPPHRPRGPIIPQQLDVELQRLLGLRLPDDGLGLLAGLREVVDVLVANATRTSDPRFLGLLPSSGNPYGTLAGLIALALNQHVTRAALSPMASAIEQQTLRWLGELTGFHPAAQGTFTSGGSTANLIGIAAAVSDRAGWDVRTQGLRAGPPLTLYASDQAHFCVEKALSILGLGTGSLRRIPTDERFRMDVPALRDAIRQDRSEGRRPIAVIANAGTVLTGAVDPLAELADLCAREDLWLHVDGAYGAAAARVPRVGALFEGLDRANSLVIDGHKWLYTPYEIAAVLVPGIATLEHAFRFGASYAGRAEGGTPPDPMDVGIQMSRDFKALRLWTLLRGVGARALRASIDDDIAVMRRMGDAVAAHPRLELMAPVELSIVCLRYRPPDMSPESLDALNAALLREVARDGRVLLTPAVVRGATGLRGCCVDFRVTDAVAAEVVSVVVELGDRLARSA